MSELRGQGAFNQLDFAKKAFNQMGFGLLCIGVWFWFALYWGLVCFCSILPVLRFGLVWFASDVTVGLISV